MTIALNGIEPLFSFQQLAQVWSVGHGQVRKIFRGRTGMINLGGGTAKATWRVPRSLVLAIMIERGYTREQAERALAAAAVDRSTQNADRNDT
ncbi:MAG TPA: hypothetical protein VI455_02160 [Terriglobia bacterium]